MSSTLGFVLLGLGSLVAGEVVESFEKLCPEFFVRSPQGQNKVITPTIVEGTHYKQICQCWKNKYRYAMLYDTFHRIPVYSAYTFYIKGKTQRSDASKIEPQLELEPTEDNQEMSEHITQETMNGFFSQATETDYRDTIYTFSHLIPNGYSADQDQDSGFRLLYYQCCTIMNGLG